MATPSVSTAGIKQDEHEWLLTNGLGGFSQGAVNGIPLRRYHAYLIAATSPPVGRVAVLQSCAEYLAIRTDNSEAVATHVPLSTFRFGSGVLSPEGVSHLKEFKLEHDYMLLSSGDRHTGSANSPEKSRTSGSIGASTSTLIGDSCVWTYTPEGTGIVVKKRLILIKGQNRCRVEYIISGAPPGSSLLVRPFVSMRDFHGLCREHSHGLISHPHDSACGVRIGFAGMGAGEGSGGGLEAKIVASSEQSHKGAQDPKDLSFRHEPQWWRNFSYDLDRARGQESHEDLYSPGVFEAVVDAPTVGWSIEAWLANPDIRVTPHSGRPSSVSSSVKSKVNASPALAFTSEDQVSINRLLHAADQFVVARASASDVTNSASGSSTQGTSIIAGYPWFSDWGRDTCISLPGLLLVRGELERATQTLAAFASLMQDGLIPNCFDNGSGHAEYNTADASLWYLNAACELATYLGKPLNPASDDQLGLIARACNSIIDAYIRGTAFDISIDPADGLVRAGNIGTQLTWMDAKRDGVVFTPRHGKPVELSALWYNGLLRVADALPASEESRKKHLQQQAARCAASFPGMFWNARTNSLFDCITPDAQAPEGNSPSNQVRPNQVFATSLTYSPLTLLQRVSVLNIIKAHLLTPYGLRTLAPDDPAYRPRYEGTLFERDGAYHNGTVWPWLMGPYVEGLLRAGDFSPASRMQAKEVISTLLRELKASEVVSGSIEQLAEIYDASQPHRPSGCPAQAWSIAELLRVFALIHLGPPTPRLDHYGSNLGALLGSTQSP